LGTGTRKLHEVEKSRSQSELSGLSVVCYTTGEFRITVCSPTKYPSRGNKWLVQVQNTDTNAKQKIFATDLLPNLWEPEVQESQ
jgi:hypothetical protein